MYPRTRQFIHRSVVGGTSSQKENEDEAKKSFHVYGIILHSKDSKSYLTCNFTFQRRAFRTYECSFDLQNNDPADCKGKSTVPVPKQDIVLYDPYHHMYGFPGINLLSRHMK